MDVLVTGADGDLGRAVAEGFRSAGHRVVVTGLEPERLELVAGELGVEAVLCDPADPGSLAESQPRFPQHLDAVVTVPGRSWPGADPSNSTLPDTALAWRSAFDRTVLSAVLTVQAVGDQLRSGGAIVAVAPAPDRGPEAAAKAALSDWVAGQAAHFGTRGITDGLSAAAPSGPAEITRLAVFLATPAARHITGQTLHVGRSAGIVAGSIGQG
jgi:NAD(P)-dependent dehydrogenase (short-subunit alcohol dehydrogenase family)